MVGDSSHHAALTNADLLCRIDAGVQVYYITPEGYVSAPSYPTCLSIYLLTGQPDEAASAGTPFAFLQVGDWVYPLLPGQSPVLQSTWGSYIFPDVSSSVPGNGIFIFCVVTNSVGQDFVSTQLYIINFAKFELSTKIRIFVFWRAGVQLRICQFSLWFIF